MFQLVLKTADQTMAFLLVISDLVQLVLQHLDHLTLLSQQLLLASQLTLNILSVALQLKHLMLLFIQFLRLAFNQILVLVNQLL